MSAPSVAVVILNWNGLALLAKFLPSVCKTRYPNLQLVVGDNASSDGSVAYILEHFPQVRVVVNEHNYGFAGGYNQVLKQLNADYFVLLNSDVEVPEDWVAPVIRAMEADPLVAAAQPKIKWQQDKTQFEYAGAAGGFLDINAFPFCRGRVFNEIEADRGQYNDAREIFWASGAALFIRSERWLETGGLDVDLFAHMEEIDLCWRLKNSGYKVIYCPDAEVYHVGGGTLSADSPYKVFLNFRNNLMIMQKNMPAGKAVVSITIRMWIDFVAWLQFLLTGRPRFALAISKAHIQFLASLRRTAAKRTAVQLPFLQHTGVYPSSIVWGFFIRGKRYFSQLRNLR